MKNEVKRFKEEANSNIYLDMENRQLYTINGGIIDFYDIPEDADEETGRKIEEEAEASDDIWERLYGSKVEREA